MKINKIDNLDIDIYLFIYFKPKYNKLKILHDSFLVIP